jgi:hypothetical protein
MPMHGEVRNQHTEVKVGREIVELFIREVIVREETEDSRRSNGVFQKSIN